MTSFEELAIAEVLRSELGTRAVISHYGREHRTPMTFVLDAVERELGAAFSVYWVDEGPPELFTLPGFSPAPVVFSTRYLSLTAFVRHMLMGPWSGELVTDVAERTALKVMAEMAVRRGDPDYAVLAFAKSVTGKGIWLDDTDRVPALEREPIGEAYMATWFYGLVHELGHLHGTQAEPAPASGLFPERWILAAIQASLDGIAAYPEALKREALERAVQRRSDSVLGVDHLRREGLADIFAASVMLETTVGIMAEIRKQQPEAEKFRVLRFVHEMIIFLNIISIIERCRQVASAASSTTPNREAQLEGLVLHPVSVMVRGQMMRQYLDHAIAVFLSGEDEPTPEQLQRVEGLVDEVNQHLAGTIRAVDSGIARAMEFSLFPDRRDNDWTLLEGLRNEVSRSATGMLEARRFCELAEGLGAQGKLLRALREIVADPRRPLEPDPAGDLVFVVPWVVGPDGFERPFGLDTRHGHLVFAFGPESPVFDAFFEPSAEMLKAGFTLKRAAVLVPRKEQLGAELAANMPGDVAFRVIVEGTPEFVQYMSELGDDTIWSD